MLRFTAIAFLFVVITACGPAALAPTAIPTQDKEALATEIAAQIYATQTASIPTATNTPTATDTPTNTNTPTSTLTALPTETPRPTTTPWPTDTVPPTETHGPTNTPRPKPTPTAQATPVFKDQTVTVLNKWEMTLLSVRRDKIIWGWGDRSETAFGVWATFIFRIRNLQSGSDYLGRSFGFAAYADGKVVEYNSLNTVEDKAQYYYSCCDTGYTLVAPGEEKVILITFDVPEATKRLSFDLTLGYLVRGVPLAIYPEFQEPNFDQVPPRQGK